MKLRVGMAQINPTIGDIAGNLAKIKSFIARAKKDQVELVIFPELSLIGYPPMDLLEKEDFIVSALSALETL
ncbi:MAG: NAD+ synthase, partial [Deltaproteobacteria bacterium]|nr:NAD+ synthase [Deltaproteobacteria bacterium]